MAAAPVPGNGAEPELPQVWLVTYGPGEVYWQRFGHNAIWIREPARGLDHVFNFGFFDFAQQDFFLRFLQGRMMYFSAAQPAQQEFAAYIDENRSIRAQRLDLSPEQAAWLTGYLLEEVRPENRDYLYDYYRNNCSTRVRDAIDRARTAKGIAPGGPDLGRGSGALGLRQAHPQPLDPARIGVDHLLHRLGQPGCVAFDHGPCALRRLVAGREPGSARRHDHTGEAVAQLGQRAGDRPVVAARKIRLADLGGRRCGLHDVARVHHARRGNWCRFAMR